MDNLDFSYKLRIKILDKEKFFGEGVAALLEQVMQTNSLLKASKNMSMAYTKALHIIQHAEDVLGYKLLERKAGGSSGGGSHLTENAEKLLTIYRQFEKNVLAYTEKEFESFIKKLGELK